MGGGHDVVPCILSELITPFAAMCVHALQEYIACVEKHEGKVSLQRRCADLREAFCVRACCDALLRVAGARAWRR